jgi:sulfate permease, SulP family
MTVRGYVRGLLPQRADYAMVRRTWRGDLIGGLTVGIVALPLALAFGVTSGAGAEAGLITAIVAGVVAAVFGGSNIQVSGPTGAMVVVLGPIVAAQGAGVVALVTIMAGAMVLVAAVLRLGRAVAVIPWPVIEGFTLGIAVIIFLQQVPAALGAPTGPSRNSLVAAAQTVAAADWSAALVPLAIVAAVAVIMVVAPLVRPWVPGSIIAIVFVTLAVRWLALPVDTIGALPAALPAPGLPSLAGVEVAALLIPAATIAALAAIESLLSARVGASLADSGRLDPDRELVGQGLASVASGLFGGMPATGAIARTAVNVRAGGRSRLAAIIHSIVLIGVVYLASTIVATIPLAALSGVLMVTAVRMVSIPTVRRIVTATRSDALIFLATAVVTIAFDLIIAVGIGILAAGVIALRALAASSGVHRESLPGEPLPGDERIALFRLDGALFFGAAERITDTISETAGATVVIVRLSQIRDLDATGARVIVELIEGLERRGITVIIKGIQERHLRLATRVGVVGALRHPNHLVASLHAAVDHARSHIARDDAASTVSAAD